MPFPSRFAAVWRMRVPRRAAAVGEALAWTAGYGVAQLVAALACILTLWVAAFAGWPPTLDAGVELLLEINLDRSFLLTGATTLGAALLLMAAVRLRCGRAIRADLAIQAPPLRSLLIAAGAIAPLAVLSNSLLDVCWTAWTQWTAGDPRFEILTQANALEAVARQGQSEPYWMLVMALAVGPAIGEELVFRGVVGRRLIGSFGIFAGVMATSVLFALMHGFPPHAIATLPLGIFLHWAYLHTKSLWTPIILHALNNAIAVAMLKFPLLERWPGSPLVVACSACYVIAVMALLARAAPVVPRGDAILIESSSGATPASRASWRATPALIGVSILGFTVSFVWSLLHGAQ